MVWLAQQQWNSNKKPYEDATTSSHLLFFKSRKQTLSPQRDNFWWCQFIQTSFAYKDSSLNRVSITHRLVFAEISNENLRKQSKDEMNRQKRLARKEKKLEVHASTSIVNVSRLSFKVKRWNTVSALLRSNGVVPHFQLGCLKGCK